MRETTDSSAQQVRDRRIAALPHLALDWLREVIDTEFEDAASFTSRPPPPATEAERRARRLPGGQDPFGVAARYARGEVHHALWYREWHRRWRGFQRSDQLHRYVLALGRAPSEKQVYSTLTEHAVAIVGGYTCLLFPPQEQTPLKPVPNAKLRVDAGRLTLSIPLRGTGLIERDAALRLEAPFASLAPLFSEERAVSLAHAPFGDGGVILLVERRQERVFGPDDWELLGVLASYAAAALARVRLGLRGEAGPGTHPASALPDDGALAPALEHATAIAARGEPVSVVALRLEGSNLVAAEDGPAAADRVRGTTAEVLRELAGSLGLAMHRSDDEFVLVLPRLTEVRAATVAARVERQLPARVRVRSGVLTLEPAPAPELMGRLNDLFRELSTRAADGAWT